MLVELASVFSRAGFSEPVELALYSIKRVGAQIARVDFREVIRLALRLSPDLKLRTLDLLHIAACHLMGAALIVTLDCEIARKKSAVSSLLGVEILHGPCG